MIKTPLFSIIIPLYNKDKYLEACLKSISTQTEKNWECIIVNDGSTDNSLKVAKRFTNEDSRFKIVDQKNAGPSVARNHGIEQSTGQLLHFMDADDNYPDTTTLKAVGAIYEKEHPTALAGNILVHDSADGSTKYDLEVNSDSIKYQTFAELQNDYFFTRFFFDREFIKDSKITFPEYTYVGEDPVFLVKALSRMDKFLVTDVPVYVYNTVKGSGSELAGYDDERLVNYMTTQLEVLEICQKNNYKKLQRRILDRIDQEGIDFYIQYKDKREEIDVGLKKILTFIDSDMHYEKVQSIRDKDERIRNLEVTALNLELEVESLKQPGIKTATRRLLGAVKRKARNTYQKKTGKV